MNGFALSCSCCCFANSTIKMAVFADRPMSSTMPIWK